MTGVCNAVQVRALELGGSRGGALRLLAGAFELRDKSRGALDKVHGPVGELARFSRDPGVIPDYPSDEDTFDASAPVVAYMCYRCIANLPSVAPGLYPRRQARFFQSPVQEALLTLSCAPHLSLAYTGATRLCRRIGEDRVLFLTTVADNQCVYVSLRHLLYEIAAAGVLASTATDADAYLTVQMENHLTGLFIDAWLWHLLSAWSLAGRPDSAARVWRALTSGGHGSRDLLPAEAVLLGRCIAHTATDASAAWTEHFSGLRDLFDGWARDPAPVRAALLRFCSTGLPYVVRRDAVRHLRRIMPCPFAGVPDSGGSGVPVSAETARFMYRTALEIRSWAPGDCWILLQCWEGCEDTRAPGDPQPTLALEDLLGASTDDTHWCLLYPNELPLFGNTYHSAVPCFSFSRGQPVPLSKN